LLEDEVFTDVIFMTDVTREPILMRENRRLERRNRGLERENRRLEKLVITDELTGLWKRNYTLDRIGELINDADRGGNCFSVVIADVDNFKLTNDTRGHAAGDRVLQHMTKIAKRYMRSNCVIGRYGGEEFIFVLPRHDPADMIYAMERVRDHVKAEAGHDFTYGAVTYWPRGHPLYKLNFNMSEYDLVQIADKCMLKNKCLKKGM
jgi:diguanylate cyclase (GGDEF)-like protein